MERIGADIRKLVSYGLRTGLVPEEDEIFTVNRLLELFGLEEPEEEGAVNGTEGAEGKAAAGAGSIISQECKIGRAHV